MSKQRAWVFGAVLAGVLIIALGWFLGISPKLDEVAAAETQTIDVEAQNAAQQARLDGLKTQFAKIGDLREQLADLQEQITPVTDLSEFVDYAEGLADASGVVVSEYAADAPIAAVTPIDASTAPAEAEVAETEATPSAETAAVDSTTPSVETDAAPGGAGLYAVPVTFNLAGTDDQVFDLVTKFQQGKQIFLVSGLTFGGDDGRVIKGYLFVKKAAEETSVDASSSSAPGVATPTAN